MHAVFYQWAHIHDHKKRGTNTAFQRSNDITLPHCQVKQLLKQVIRNDSKYREAIVDKHLLTENPGIEVH